MQKLGFMLSFLPGLAFAQAANTEVPIEPSAGAGAVVVFGLIVVAGIVAFVIVMNKRKPTDAEAAGKGK